jgi:hypothetical protein
MSAEEKKASPRFAIEPIPEALESERAESHVSEGRSQVPDEGDPGHSVEQKLARLSDICDVLHCRPTMQNKNTAVL